MSICAHCDSVDAPEPFVLGDRAVFGLCPDCQLVVKDEVEAEEREDGQRLADLRCYVADNGKGRRDIPTQKGISVRVEDLPKLRAHARAGAPLPVRLTSAGDPSPSG